MFVDLECDALLIRDLLGPFLYCRNCNHYTYPWSFIYNRRLLRCEISPPYAVTYKREGDLLLCEWCKSADIGGQPKLIEHVRCMGSITEPEDREPTKHQKLKEGFALLHAAETSI